MRLARDPARAATQINTKHSGATPARIDYSDPARGPRMFGRHKLLRTGVEAQAVITSVRSVGAAQVNLEYSPVSWHLELSVYSADGSTGDVECRVDALTTELVLSAEKTVPVRYDPGDRLKVAVDVPAMEALRKAGHDQADARVSQKLQQAWVAGRSRSMAVTSWRCGAQPSTHSRRRSGATRPLSSNDDVSGVKRRAAATG